MFPTQTPRPRPPPRHRAVRRPPFRVLRRYLRSNGPDAPNTYILSAKFGLIPADHAIPDYDHRMTAPQAKALRPDVTRAVQRILISHPTPNDVLLSLGADYFGALDLARITFPPVPRTLWAHGRQGERLGQLHDWLWRQSPSQPTAPPSAIEPRRARIRGVDVTLTAEHVLDVARARGRDDRAAVPRTWIVPTTEHAVAPTWLVRELTGLPVSAFTTTEARSFLARLGVEVRRR